MRCGVVCAANLANQIHHKRQTMQAKHKQNVSIKSTSHFFVSFLPICFIWRLFVMILLVLCVFGLHKSIANPAKTPTAQAKKTNQKETPNQAQSKQEAKSAKKDSTKSSTKSAQASQSSQTTKADNSQKQTTQKQAKSSKQAKEANAKQVQAKQVKEEKLIQKELKKQAKLRAKLEKNAPPKNLLKRNLKKALNFSPFYVGIPSFLWLDEIENLSQMKPQRLRTKQATLGEELEEVCEGSEVDFICVSQVEILSPHIKLSNFSQHFKLFPNTLQVELSASVSSEKFLDKLSFHTPSQRGEIEKILPKDFRDILTIKKEGANISYDYRVRFSSGEGTEFVLEFDGNANNPLYEHKSLAEFLLDFMISVVPKSVDYKELCQNLSRKECARIITRKKAQLSITLFSPKNLKASLTSQNFSDTMYAIYAIDVANRARVSDRETYKKDIQSTITQESLSLRKDLANHKMPINTHNFALDFLSAFGGFFIDSERLGLEISAQPQPKERLLLRDFVEDSGRLRDFLGDLRFSVIR